MAGPKVFVWDLENSPIMGDVWSLWNNNLGLVQIQRDWICLSWAGKWLGDDYVYSDSLISHPNYKADPEDDEAIMLTLWDYLDEADIVVGHNMRNFDMKKVRARMLKHGIPPFSPCQIIDTLEIAKKAFKLTSNKLQYIADLLGIGSKMDTGGHQLWVDCMRGDKKAWKKMVAYNELDTVLTEDVYLALAPWSAAHPNHALYSGIEAPACTVCGSADLRPDGHAFTNMGKFQRYQCNDCGKYMRGRKNKADRSMLLTNVI